MALLIAGAPRLPGLRVRATRPFEDPHPGAPAGPDATPALVAGRYTVDGLVQLPEELVVELLDPHLPPLLIECLPDGLLVGTAGTRVPVSDLAALTAAAARLSELLLADVAAVTSVR